MNMGVFDRLWNLGRGKVRTIKSRGGPGLSDAELEAELANVRPEVAPLKDAAPPDSAAEPEAPEAEAASEGPARDADGHIIKTL